MATGYKLEPLRCWFIKSDADCILKAPGSNAFRHSLWKMRKVSLGSAFRGFQWCIEPAHGTLREAADFGAIAQKISPALPFRRYFLRLYGILSKSSA